jgi:GMP synthase (glutamine-hydrolysing)
MEGKELILVMDFGGQYNQLIARRVRDQHVYAEVIPSTTPLDKVLARKPKGIIFTGGPNSVYKEDSLTYDPAILSSGIPILGICYGSQLMAHLLGGTVKTAPVSEYGHTDLTLDAHVSSSKLFKGVAKTSTVWMSHTDRIESVPEGFAVTASTANCPIAAFENEERKLYAVQFHP